MKTLYVQNFYMNSFDLFLGYLELLLLFYYVAIQLNIFLLILFMIQFLFKKISYCLILYFIYTGHELCIIMQPYCLKYYEKIVPIDKEKTIISTLRQLFSTSPVRLAIVCLSIFVLLLRAEVFIIIHLAKF